MVTCTDMHPCKPSRQHSMFSARLLMFLLLCLVETASVQNLLVFMNE